MIGWPRHKSRVARKFVAQLRLFLTRCRNSETPDCPDSQLRYLLRPTHCRAASQSPLSEHLLPPVPDISSLVRCQLTERPAKSNYPLQVLVPVITRPLTVVSAQIRIRSPPPFFLPFSALSLCTVPCSALAATDSLPFGAHSLPLSAGPASAKTTVQPALSRTVQGTVQGLSARAKAAYQPRKLTLPHTSL